ncbi:ADP-ribosyltransferase [Mucilaginibacter sp.]|jgi:hypothetical protein|uniref:ADP-ribosyltransferase n=1 Tax=Mucilaginibacter sp. TaxID=1882438 RepID=UPI002B973424|nr:ADP-ribosyltransferase [Mucilaginibacter sp.]HTI60905.1 ADP-ribosyltransferase [Mucilaginibacter sp.]
MNLKEFIDSYPNQKDHHNVSMKRLHDKAFKSWMEDCENEHPQEPRVNSLKQLGLNAEDGFFIWSYTGSCSSWLNCDKRDCNEHNSECKKHFANALERALQKLSPFEGKVWRWEQADENLRKFNWFKDNVGLTVRVPYFLSTSKDDITADPMLWEITTISNGHARDISEISNNLHENEVLFLPDAKFKIISVKDDNRTIIMQELSPDAVTEFDLCRAYDHDPEDVDPNMVIPGIFD